MCFVAWSLKGILRSQDTQNTWRPGGLQDSPKQARHCEREPVLSLSERNGVRHNENCRVIAMIETETRKVRVKGTLRSAR